jgi:hypothetical protein
MAHTCDLCYLGGWDGESRLKTSLGKNSPRLHFNEERNNNVGCGGTRCHSRGDRKYKIEDHSPDQLGKRETLSPN